MNISEKNIFAINFKGVIYRCIDNKFIKILYTHTSIAHFILISSPGDCIRELWLIHSEIQFPLCDLSIHSAYFILLYVFLLRYSIQFYLTE
jgi:hypothetical protein